VSVGASHGRVMASGQHCTRPPRVTAAAAAADPGRPPAARPTCFAVSRACGGRRAEGKKTQERAKIESARTKNK
jgi:hypothetical protein